jgi:hypothetical protein
MNKIRFTSNAITALLFILACASFAQAQATRTWVSGVGDDVNPCSRTAPCKTFAGAISKTAAGGEIDALDPGGFGAVTITKSITIDGTTGAGFGSILSSGTNGVNVNDSATGSPGTIVVTLRNLSINGAGTTLGLNGVNFTSGRSVHVQNCNIFNFSSNGINVNLTLGGKNLTVQDSTIREIGGSGVSVTTSNATGVAAVLTNVVIDKTTSCVSAAANSVVTIRNSSLSLSTNGVNTANPSQVNIDESLFANNSTGVNVVAGATARLSTNTFANNITGVANAGTTQSNSNNKFMGNLTDRSGPAFGSIGVQ